MFSHTGVTTHKNFIFLSYLNLPSLILSIRNCFEFWMCLMCRHVGCYVGTNSPRYWPLGLNLLLISRNKALLKQTLISQIAKKFPHFLILTYISVFTEFRSLTLSFTTQIWFRAHTIVLEDPFQCHPPMFIPYFFQTTHLKKKQSLHTFTSHSSGVSHFRISKLNMCSLINRSVYFYASTTFILTNKNWTTFFDCYSVILRSFSGFVSQRVLYAHWDPKCVYIKT